MDEKSRQGEDKGRSRSDYVLRGHLRVSDLIRTKYLFDNWESATIRRKARLSTVHR